MKFFYISIIFFVALPVISAAQNAWSVSSPDKRIRFDLQVNKEGPAYQVSFNNKMLINKAVLSLDMKNGRFQKELTVGKVNKRSGVERYNLIVGKKSSVSDAYNELRVPLIEKNAAFRRVDLVVRAFNDAIGFRYEFPQQKNWQELILKNEYTSFTPVGNPRVLCLQLPNYTSSHEGEYTSSDWNSLKEDTLMDMPALFQFSDNAYMAISEAALINYAGMYLVKRDGKLVSQLSPWPNDSSIAVKAGLPFHTPWRVLLIGDKAGTLMESTVISSLAPPNKLKDTSWIKTGKTTFPWWNGTIISDSSVKQGNNFESNKYYIDFCARNGLEFHSVVESGGHEWYTNDGEGYQPGNNVDITKPVDGLDMKQVCDYAKEKGVGVRVWVHWKALYPKIDTAFALFEKWGLKGMMIDFMDRDDQEMVNIQEEMLQKAAKHKLHVQFHGAYKPTGLWRTYPNEFTREGTLNYEVNKWDKKITPDHDLNIVFTRMLAGPADYHMGGFRAVPDSLFEVQLFKPLMMGTRCHMLGMYVVLENYLGMVCDYPDAYEGEPGFEFVKAVPTIWDDTKVLDAQVHKYVIIARRKGNEWWVGAINNHEPRTIAIDFSFLPKGSHNVIIYKDAPDAAQHPNKLIKEERKVKSGERLKINLAGGGGLGMVIK